jgi:RND superfamily putative drug exporter
LPITYSNGDLVTADSERRPMLGRAAIWSFTHRWPAVAVWLVALVAITGVGRWAGSQFLDDFSGGNSQSQQAQDLLSRSFPEDSGDRAQIVFHADGRLTATSARSAVEAVVREARSVPHVTAVGDPYATAGGGRLSFDRRTAYAIVQFDQTADRLPASAPDRLLALARASDSDRLHVVVGGAPIAKVQKPAFGKSEGIGLLAALVILLFAFGSLVAAGLPIVTALAGLAIAFGILDLVSHGQTVPTWAPEFAALLGIGVGIDYALFIVTRYRERLADGEAPVDAIATALTSSGKAVLFAGGTVVVSLLGLLVVGLPYITGAALGAILAVLLVMCSALTLLPALLGALGPRIDRLSVRRNRRGSVAEGTWSWRWSHGVQRHAAVTAVAGVTALVVLSLPLFALRVGYSDAGNDPKSTETRMAYDLLARNFGPGAVGPLVAVASLSPTGPGPAELATLRSEITRRPDVAAVASPRFNSARDTAVIDVIPRSAPQAESTVALVQDLRHIVASPKIEASGLRVLIGGETAASIDSSAHLSHRLAPVIVFVVILSMLLLLAALRSPVIALKAAVMNLLSTGAAYGVIVAAFQWGWLGHGLTAGRDGPIDPWIPVMLFTILFGLSMDYELFLMSRVREHWARHRDSQAAVVDGLAATARVITAAAAIMVCVFASFVLSDVRPLRIFGLGMATAVLVDATVVRLMLVPSIMQLLGRAAWWMPRWLDRMLPTPSLEAGQPTVRKAAA